MHNVTGFYITTAFVVMGVGAYLLRRGRAPEDARMMIRMALDLLIILLPVQMFLGDQHGLNTLEYQPAKLAAIEGRYDTVQPTPLTLFGIPDDAAAVMRYAIEIPDLGSLLLTHSRNGVIKGLKEWPADQRPPVGPPFFAFRVMVGIGVLMLLVVIVGQIMKLRGRLWDSVWFLRLCQWMAPLGFIAVLAGWTTTEVGRQPWTVYGLLRTADSVSPSLTGANVALSFALYIVVYLIMYPTGVALMAGLVRRGPQGQSLDPEMIEGGRPNRPFENAARAASEP
jgi:cytochrome d ubiquinol oxidase subunit I